MYQIKFYLSEKTKPDFVSTCDLLEIYKCALCNYFIFEGDKRPKHVTLNVNHCCFEIKKNQTKESSPHQQQQKIKGEPNMANYRIQALLGLWLLASSTLFHTILANHVRRIEVLTSDCEDCGMSILGQLSVKVLKSFSPSSFFIFYETFLEIFIALRKRSGTMLCG